MSKLVKVVCGALAVGSMAALPGIPALAACKMARMAELPVTMVGLAPLIDAKINGTDVRFVVDSGAFFSMIGAASAAALNLKLGPAPYGMFINGLAGRGAKPSVTTVDTFTLAGIPVHNIGFFVSGSLSGLNGGSVGLLGQNVFGVSDVEYDFARGKVRFIKVDDCQRAMLAYWVPGGQPYSVIDIDPMSNYHTHITSRAYLNGAKIAVTFDTGAPFSILSLRSAARADVDPKSSGVVEGGLVGGVGYGVIKSYVGVFSRFKVGDEEVQHARLRFGGSFAVDTDMLIGADFFLCTGYIWRLARINCTLRTTAARSSTCSKQRRTRRPESLRMRTHRNRPLEYRRLSRRMVRTRAPPTTRFAAPLLPHAAILAAPSRT